MSGLIRKDPIPNSTPAKRRRESHDDQSEFRVVNASLVLSVPPVFAANPRAGAQEMLDSMIMRYNPALQGVVLSHSNLTFVDNVARIQADCPFLICKVAFDATVWSPRIGFSLFGRVNLCSPDHISLLVHKTFNVSIPRHHIPTDNWEFEYGPAENDPEFGQDEPQADVEGDGDDDQPIDHSSGGRWVHRVTGEVLGDLIEFTVIGLTVANEMLSLLGSLQPDPFSPRHVIQSKPDVQNEDETDSESDAHLGLEGDESVSEEAEDSDEDTFQRLGKKRDLEVEETQRKKRKQNG